MSDPKTIVNRLQSLSFHDDRLLDLRVSAPQTLQDLIHSPVIRATVEVLISHWSEQDQARQLLRICFSGCRNLRVTIDFDLLAGNSPNNISGLTAHTDMLRMRELITSQQVDTNVEYVPESASPLPAKLATLEELVAFQVQLFGGTIELLARNYTIEVLSADDSSNAG